MNVFQKLSNLHIDAQALLDSIIENNTIVIKEQPSLAIEMLQYNAVWQIVLQKEYQGFREALINMKPICIDRVTIPSTFSYEIVQQVAELFSKDIISYVENCLELLAIQELYDFLQFRYLFSEEIMTKIQVFVKKKLDKELYLIEQKEKPLLSQKLAIHHVPFFKVLDVLGAGHFQQMVWYLSDLLSTNYPDQAFSHRIYYAIAFFASAEESYQSVYATNKQKAIAFGVRQDRKGFTYVDTTFKDTGGFSYRQLFIALGIAVSIVFMVLIYSFFSSINKKEVKNTQAIEERIETNKIKQRIKDAIPEHADSLRVVDASSFVVQVLANQSLKIPNNAESKSIAFTVENTRWKALLSSKERYEGLPTMYVENQSKQDLILRLGMLDNYHYFEFISPEQRVSIPKITRNIVLYSGENFEEIFYTNTKGRDTSVYRFAQFTESNIASLERYKKTKLRIEGATGLVVFKEAVKNRLKIRSVAYE